MNAKRTAWVALLSAAALASCAAKTSPTDDDDDPDEPYQVAVWCGAVCATEGRCVDTAQCECFYFPLRGYDECFGEGPLPMSGNNEEHMDWECCQAYSDADCEQSSECALYGRCTACRGYCFESCD